MSTKPFTIYAIQSAHTDIGYTHPQEQIKLMYLDHYDRMLALCKQYEHEPIEHRFKWVCETSWQVKHFLAHCPDRLDEFLHFVRNGQIEITASYLHFTDLIDTDAYRRSLDWVIEFCRKHQLPLKSAMHCDINGWAWSLADILADAGIPYFLSQIHIDSATDPLGKRGSVHYHWTMEWKDWLKSDTPIRVPQAFWWQGPRGGKVLHWLNEHYHLGNFLGLSSNHPFYAEKTRYFLETDHLSVDAVYTVAQREMKQYVDRLKAEGYPYDMMLLSAGGFFVDNAPPDGRWCEVIRRWNNEHDDIKVRTATVTEWFEALQTQDQRAWPTRQVAWPDHWAHGIGSVTANVARARRGQRRRANAVALVQAANTPSANQYLDEALEQERFALEHTFDAWCTTALPHSGANAFQHDAKALNFYRAEMYLDEAQGAALRRISPAPTQPTLYVYAKDAIASACVLHFDGGDQILDPARQALQTTDGRVIPFQRERDDLAQFVASINAIPAGLTELRLIDKPATSGDTTPVQNNEANTLRSERWQLQVDPKTGGLNSLIDKTTQREWVQANAANAFGQLVQEAVVHPAGRSAVGNPARLLALDVVKDDIKQELPNLDVPLFEHNTPQVISEPVLVSGPVFNEIRVKAAAPRIGQVNISWRLYHQPAVVELVLDWEKLWCDLPEAAYVVFPFANGTNGAVQLETAGGLFTPGQHGDGGQLAGTSSRYYTVQRAAQINADGQQLLWLPIDAPLVLTNEPRFNYWETEPYSWNGVLASMPVNHYWHTNFATSQRGFLRLRYRIAANTSNDFESSVASALPLEAIGWR